MMQFQDPPSKIRLNISEYCNLRCKFCTCNRSGFKNRMMTFDKFKLIIDQIKKYSPNAFLSIMGKGEPLLNPNCSEMVRYAFDANIRVISFTTNGMLLNTDLQKEFIKSSTGQIGFSVSIDGLEETYNKIRIGADYEKVVNNVCDFIDRKNTSDKDNIQISVNMTKEDHSDDEIIGYINFWAKKNVDQIVIRSLFDIRNHSFITQWVNPKLLPEFDNRLPCEFLTSFLQFEYSGEVNYLCFGPYGHEKIIDFNVNNQNLSKIWESNEYKKIRSNHLTNEKSLVPLCKDCQIWKIDYLDVSRKVLRLNGHKYLNLKNAYLNIFKRIT